MDAISWKFSYETIPLLLMVPVCIAFIIVLSRNIAKDGALALLVVVAGALAWSLGEAGELSAKTLTAVVTCSKFQYLGILTIPPAWLVFSLQFSQRKEWVTSRTLLALTVFPVIGILIVFTNDVHHLNWRETWIQSYGALSVLGSRKGPFYPFVVIHAYVLLLAGTLILLRSILRQNRLYKRQAAFMLIMILAPMTCNIIYQAHLGPFPFLDLTPMAFTFCALTLTWNFLRFGLLFSPVSVSKNQIIQSISDGVLVLDLNQKIMHLNAAAQAMLGASAEAFMGRSVQAVLELSEDVSTFFRESGASAVTSAKAVLRPTRSFEVSLSPFRARLIGIMGTVLVLRDVTERLQIEDALRQSEAKYRSLFNALSDGLILMRLNGSMVDVNDEVCRALDYSKECLLQLRAGDLFAGTSPDDPERVRHVERAGHEIYETALRRSNGTLLPVEFSASLVDYGRERVLLGIARDISARKQAEEKHKILQVQFNQAQKMESIGRLAGGIAHDFNNLLSVILGYGDILSAELTADPSSREGLLEMIAAGQRAKDLVRQLLAFSRKQVLDIKVVDLNAVIRGLEKMLPRVLGEDVTLKFALARGPICSKVDAGQVEQVLLNLCVNARDAMPNGGTLTIETSTVTIVEGQSHIYGEVAPGVYAVLRVRDTGIGMDETTQKQIFDPFFTTKEAGKGTGLGLSTVFGIVKQHGGDIQVESVLGHGTTFSIYLSEYRMTANKAGGQALASPIPGHGEVILVLEDDAAVRSLACLLLSRQGYRVVGARNAQECLSFAESLDRIDLLITDVVMPGMNGKEVRDRVMSMRPGLKCLFISGYPDHIIADKGVLDAGINLLSKPFNEASLCREVRRVLDQSIESTP